MLLKHLPRSIRHDLQAVPGVFALPPSLERAQVKQAGTLSTALSSPNKSRPFRILSLRSAVRAKVINVTDIARSACAVRSTMRTFDTPACLAKASVPFSPDHRRCIERRYRSGEDIRQDMCIHVWLRLGRRGLSILKERDFFGEESDAQGSALFHLRALEETAVVQIPGNCWRSCRYCAGRCLRSISNRRQA